MKIWMASYPRSGNTFLRLVLKTVFDVGTTSIYKGETSRFDRVGLVNLTGHFEDDIEDSCATASGHSVKLIKTHGEPADNAPAIYIIRDGRYSIISYFHYIRAIGNRIERMEDIIEGKVWPGSWSQHVRCWDPLRRRNTLLIRYEDLKFRNDDVCERIAEFLDILPKRRFSTTFEELHAAFPSFFRAGGSEKDLAEIEPHIALFDHFHGATMRELGYID